MKRDTVNYVVVGMFVLAVGAALVYSIYRISGKSGPVDQYHVYYKDVAGLKYGTPVFFQGYQIGQVEDVSPEPLEQGITYRVSVSVNKDWPIPDDSIARIFASGLLSAKSININQGESLRKLLPGNEIKGEAELGMMVAINNAADTLRELSQSVLPIITTLEGNINGLVTDMRKVTNEDLSVLLETANRRINSPVLFAKIENLLTRLNDSAENLQQFVTSENSQLLTAFLTNIESVSGNLDGLIGRIELSRQQMDKVLVEVEGLAGDNREELHQAIVSLRNNMQVIEQHIEAVSYNLEGSSRNMHEFTRQIRENPSLLFLGSSPQSEKGSKQ